MSEVKSHKTIPNSQISLRGKTLSKMREIAEVVFMDSFVSINVDRKKEMFIIVIENNVPQRTLHFFIEKYEQCQVKVCQNAAAPSQKKKN